MNLASIFCSFQVPASLASAEYLAISPFAFKWPELFGCGGDALRLHPTLVVSAFQTCYKGGKVPPLIPARAPPPTLAELRSIIFDPFGLNGPNLRKESVLPQS